MREVTCTDGVYRTALRRISLFDRAFPSLAHYRRFLGIVYKASRQAKRGEYDDAAWSDSSLDVLCSLEAAGMRLKVTGFDHVKQLGTPYVLIGNHMSVMETMVLPGLLRPIRPVTFVVKESLLTTPVFGYVMRSRDPIAVGRSSPREDLKAVLEGGVDRLKRGISIIVFPQTTRTHSFDPEQFSTIGVKLARKAGVPIVPAALLTDAWENGKRIKDFGKLDPSKEVRIELAEPMHVQGRGTEEHEKIIQFINEKLTDWRRERGEK